MNVSAVDFVLSCSRVGIMSLPRKEPVANWWSKVDRRGLDECWPWLAGRDKDGYGKFAVGLGGKKQRHVRAHRFGYEVLVGPITAGQHVLHRCDNPPCCNPTHWFLGSNQDNVDDRQSKGRHARVWGLPLSRSRQTECKRGHPLSGTNLWVNPKTGHRVCKRCAAEAQMRYYRKYGPSPRRIIQCVDCGITAPNKAHDRCANCDAWWRRKGTPRPRLEVSQEVGPE